MMTGGYRQEVRRLGAELRKLKPVHSSGVVTNRTSRGSAVRALAKAVKVPTKQNGVVAVFL